MAPVRLAVFEDNKAFRESLQQLFRFTPDMDLVASFSDCSQIETKIPEIHPDVILMDIDMPGMNGIEATAIVRRLSPETQVMMLTVSEEEDRVFQALRNGASGYLLKKTGPDELIESIRSLHAGGSPMTPAIARKVLSHFHQNANATTSLPPQPDNPLKITNNFESSTPLLSTLTPRERAILEGLVDGLSYKMIAARYETSPETVKNQIQGVYRKLHINSKSEAILIALGKK
jgi:DNA-binding NarL/FixJ family response regulator